jgi:diguanylate cyclase (GGDEF)-like protein
MAELNTETTANKGKDTHLMSRFLTVLLAFLVGAAIFGLLAIFEKKNDFIDELEKKTYDIRVALPFGENPEHRPSQDILIIKFDDPTFNALEEEYGTWPWPRSVHAEMIEFLNKAGARALAYDIMFVAKKKGLEESDKALIDAFKRYPNVYLSMNFDNNKWIGDQLGKGLTMKDIEMAEPLSLNLRTDLNPLSSSLPLKNGFFDNDAMTFNSFRRIMPGFFDVKDRIAFINHGRDKDSVSRSNPLFFRFVYLAPIKSQNKPFTQDPKTGQWQDAMGQAINAEGDYLMPDGQVKLEPQFQYYPYLGLKLAMDLKLPKGSKTPMTLTEDGRLVFEGYDVPLVKRGSTAGSLLIDWYNINIEEQLRQSTLQQLIARQGELQAKLQHAAPITRPVLQHEIDTLETYIQQLKMSLSRDFEAMPYQEIPAWKIIRLMKNQKAGQLNEEDTALLKLLKDKVIFIGTTAVSTYDIKTTPINKLLPGVVLQATIFDNLYQNKGYMHRAEDHTNLLLTVLLCVSAALVILKMRSAVSGLITTMMLAGLYVVVSILALKHLSVWINIAMPMISLVVVTILTFMVKYMNRDQDYKKTYKLATTDGLTGLYNHRFFQEHMANAIDTAVRFNGKFSLVLIDIDFFKKFNDTYGHQAGDEVLRHVARKLRTSVRSVDLVARYGGEEMAIILDKANETEALEVARKLVRLVAEEEYPIAEGVAKHVTVSIGVATFPTHGKTPSELIEFADRGLYRAKEGGRNQVGAQYDAEMPGEGGHKASA